MPVFPLFLAQTVQNAIKDAGESTTQAAAEAGPALPLVIAPIVAFVVILVVYFVLRKMRGTH